MTSKLEELRAAFEAATPGEWETDNGLIYGPAEFESFLVCDVAGGAGTQLVREQDERNAAFITLAHNAMPDLLEAMKLLKRAQVALNTAPRFHVTSLGNHVSSYDIAGQIDKLLEKLEAS